MIYYVLNIDTFYMTYCVWKESWHINVEILNCLITLICGKN